LLSKECKIGGCQKEVKQQALDNSKRKASYINPILMNKGKNNDTLELG